MLLWNSVFPVLASLRANIMYRSSDGEQTASNRKYFYLLVSQGPFFAELLYSFSHIKFY
jgi:hypothetical protein